MYAFSAILNTINGDCNKTHSGTEENPYITFKNQNQQLGKTNKDPPKKPYENVIINKGTF